MSQAAAVSSGRRCRCRTGLHGPAIAAASSCSQHRCRPPASAPCKPSNQCMQSQTYLGLKQLQQLASRDIALHNVVQQMVQGVHQQLQHNRDSCQHGVPHICHEHILPFATKSSVMLTEHGSQVEPVQIAWRPVTHTWNSSKACCSIPSVRTALRRRCCCSCRMAALYTSNSSAGRQRQGLMGSRTGMHDRSARVYFRQSQVAADKHLKCLSLGHACTGCLTSAWHGPCLPPQRIEGAGSGSPVSRWHRTPPCSQIGPLKALL